MVLESSRPYLKALAKRIPQLNEATDRYMDELQEIEAELQRLSPGIEVELDQSLKETVQEEECSTDEEHGVPYHYAWVLGYGKIKAGNWCLVVRSYKVTHPENPQITTWTLLETTPLLQAPRDLRIASAEQIPALLDRLEKEAVAKIETLKNVTDRR